MILSLNEIIDIPGGVLPFDYTTDFSDLEINFAKPFTGPVSLCGTVRNSAGVLTLKGSAEAEIEFDCMRCAERTKTGYAIDFSVTLVEELSDPDDIANADIIIIQNAEIDIDASVRDLLILDIDMVFLCKDDCAGVCSTCGKNLNDGDCGCKGEPDPRLAKLRELLES